MSRILLIALLGVVSLTGFAQTVPDATATSPEPAPSEINTTAAVNEGAASEFVASDGNFGPHATCETATKATSNNYDQTLRQVLSQYPGYTVLDQHSVDCGGKQGLVLVLVTMNGSLPAKIHTIEFSP